MAQIPLTGCLTLKRAALPGCMGPGVQPALVMAPRPSPPWGSVRRNSRRPVARSALSWEGREQAPFRERALTSGGTLVVPRVWEAGAMDLAAMSFPLPTLPAFGV